jgi:hypothetical protein
LRSCLVVIRAEERFSRSELKHDFFAFLVCESHYQSILATFGGGISMLTPT